VFFDFVELGIRGKKKRLALFFRRQGCATILGRKDFGKTLLNIVNKKEGQGLLPTRVWGNIRFWGEGVSGSLTKEREVRVIVGEKLMETLSMGRVWCIPPISTKKHPGSLCERERKNRTKRKERAKSPLHDGGELQPT